MIVEDGGTLLLLQISEELFYFVQLGEEFFFCLKVGRVHTPAAPPQSIPDA